MSKFVLCDTNNLHGICLRNVLAKSLNAQLSSRLNVNKIDQANLAELFIASFVA